MSTIRIASEGSPRLLDLLFEIKDEIASNLREYSDLLSLALTHSIWSEVIIPDHLHYRTIYSSEETRNPHWEHLLENRRRSDNVQVLHVGSHPQRRTPWYDPPDGRDYYAEYILTKAVKSFRNLRSFTFIGYDKYGFTVHEDDREVTLWSQLEHSCPYLEELAVEGVFACPGCILQAEDMRQRPSPLYSLKAKNLRSFRQVVECHPPRHLYNPTPLCDMLTGFSQLRILSLTGYTELRVTDSSVFFQLRFPVLESFEFVGFPYPKDSETLIGFFTFHDEMRTLDLRFSRSSLQPFSEAPAIAGLLPQLAVCSTQTVLATSLFQLSPDEPRRPLASLGLRDVNVDDWAKMPSLLGQVGQNLQNLSIRLQWDFHEEMHLILGLIAATCRRLRTLQISVGSEDGWMGPSVIQAGGPAISQTSSLWISLLPRFSALVTLNIQSQKISRALGLHRSPSRIEAITELVASAPPKLRHLTVLEHTILVRPVEEQLPLPFVRDIERRLKMGFNPFSAEGTIGNKKWELYWFIKFSCLETPEVFNE